MLTTGWTVYRDTLRMRGLTIKRYPRWPSEDLDQESQQHLYDELENLGAFSVPLQAEPAATQPGPAAPSESQPAEEAVVEPAMPGSAAPL
ncbi:MAG: hypothetical protein EXR58_07935 [Chloroflexi bacterium]|nr:hypothetical protein [Chloroflexota bacterium]